MADVSIGWMTFLSNVSRCSAEAALRDLDEGWMLVILHHESAATLKAAAESSIARVLRSGLDSQFTRAMCSRSPTSYVRSRKRL